MRGVNCIATQNNQFRESDERIVREKGKTKPNQNHVKMDKNIVIIKLRRTPRLKAV